MPKLTKRSWLTDKKNKNCTDMKNNRDEIGLCWV
jgi:hypothetical protein